jgi:hypothetical protein
MIIYVTGQTGLEKKSAVRGLAKYMLEQEGVSTPLDHPSAKQVVRLFDLEDKIKSEMNSLSLKPFLDTLSNFMREAVWRKAAEAIVCEARNLLDSENPPQHVILSFHAVFYRDHGFLNCINPTIFLPLKPDIVITLIDDCQDIAFRVTEQRERLGIPTRTGAITLAEILSWRSAEIMLSTIVCRLFTPEPKYYVFPVKHPDHTLYSLAIESANKLICYASYPMTNIRHDQDSMEEICGFLRYLEGNFIVFNPGTIDEFRGFNRDLARLPLDKPLVCPTENNYAAYFDELSELDEVIRDHVADRDYTLVRQSEIVVAYRPFWGGLSGGVEKEIGHALTEGREVYVFSPGRDSDGLDKNVFKIIEKAVVFEEMEELKEKLQSLQEKKAKGNA